MQLFKQDKFGLDVKDVPYILSTGDNGLQKVFFKISF